MLVTVYTTSYFECGTWMTGANTLREQEKRTTSPKRLDKENENRRLGITTIHLSTIVIASVHIRRKLTQKENSQTSVENKQVPF